MSQLIKVPLNVVLATLFSIMFTSPNPVPPKHEMVSTAKIDWIAGRNFILKMSRAGTIFLASAEIATILANAYPSSSFSQSILSVLIFKGGDANRIQLNRVSYLAAILWIVGGLMRMQTYKDLGRFFRYDLSIQTDHELVTTGLYAYVRHPSYSGIVIADLGWCMWHAARGSWVRESGFWDPPAGRLTLLVFIALFMVPGPAFTLSRMANEDQALRQKFGKKWDVWAKKVPYWLIPGLY